MPTARHALRIGAAAASLAALAVMPQASAANSDATADAAAVYTDNMVPVGPDGPGRWGCYSTSAKYGGNICRTDNAKVYYYMDSYKKYKLEAPDRAAVKETMRDEFAPTDLVIKYDSTPVFKGHGETDIIYQEGSDNLSENAAGMTWCDDGGDSNLGKWECDQQYIRIRGNGVYDISIACHETGHAVGLVHGDEAIPRKNPEDPKLGCMIRKGYDYDLGANNTAHINRTY
ncbi:hypothetical protein [Streptomyces apocyni]|uniref:hypothetical protein n=1 Tax=Streptomyces apocyni TaxID=2654677 RepID=UPI0012EAC6C4|nr:hypothetical protein [Streptomyces apocyni]